MTPCMEPEQLSSCFRHSPRTGGGGGSPPAFGRLSPCVYTHTDHVIIVKICKNSRKQRKFVC